MYNMTSDVGLPSFEEVIKDCSKNDKGALIIASGGLDSAYTLWKYSRIKDKIHVHHFDMYPNKIDRSKPEKIALNKQIEYLRAEGKEIILHTSEINTDWKGILLADWYLSAVLSIEIASYNKLSYIVIGDDLLDSYDRDQSFSEMPENKKKIITAMGNFIENYSVTWSSKLCTANESNRLSELYMEMPSEFQKMTFSCRTPISTQHFYRACGECHACMKNRNFGWWPKIGKELRKE